MYSPKVLEALLRDLHRTNIFAYMISADKYFTSNIEETSFKRKKSWKILVRKTTTHRNKNQKLKYYLPHVVLLLRSSFIPLFSATHYDMMKAHVFWHNTIPLTEAQNTTVTQNLEILACNFVLTSKIKFVEKVSCKKKKP